MHSNPFYISYANICPKANNAPHITKIRLHNTNAIVSVTEANQNFSRVARIAEQNGQAMQNAKKLLFATTVTTVLCFSLIALFSNQLVSLYDLTPEELTVAAYHTRFAAILTICAGYSMSFVPMGSFRSAGDIRYPVIVTTSTMFIFRVGLSYLLCYVFHLGLMSVWIGMAADWLCRTILNSIHFARGKWLEQKLI